MDYLRRSLPFLFGYKPMPCDGAQERTRTSTPLRAPAPEAGASTNSATWALVAVGRPRRLGAADPPCQCRNERAIGPPMIERNEQLVTVFGGSGFIGRYVCEQLFRAGVRVRVASRDPRNAYFIQPLGQVGPVRIRTGGHHRPSQRPQRGKERDGGREPVRRFRSQHARRPRRGRPHTWPRPRGKPARERSSISRRSPPTRTPGPTTAARKARAKRRSARLSRRPRSSARRWSSAPKTTSPTASPRWRDCPSSRSIAAKRNFQPVYVRDLAKAIAMAALDPGRFGGKTYEIGGPQVMSMMELHRAILEITGQNSEDRPDARLHHRTDRQPRLPPRRADHARPMADAPARQCAD